MVTAIAVGCWSAISPSGFSVLAGESALSVRLWERNDSGVSGRARLEASGSDTRIEITVKDAAEQYLSYVHRGTCDAYAESPAVPLSIASASEPSATSVDMSLKELSGGDFVIDLHVAAGSLTSLMDPKSSVACGIVEDAGASSAGGPGEVAEAPVTGIGPFDGENGWHSTIAGVLLAGGFVAAIAGIREHRQTPAHELVIIDVVAMHRFRGLMR